MNLLRKNKLTLKSILIDRELLITVFVIFLCLFFGIAFPTENSAQLLTKSLFFLVIFPAIYIKLILKKNLSDFGLNLKNKQIGIIWGGGSFLFSLLIFYLLINYSGFGSGYKLPDQIISSFWWFIFYELVIVNFIIFISEFFFRGFLISFFRKKFEHWSIIIQAGIFLFILIAIEPFSWQILPLLLISITGGILTYKTKSFLYSYFVNFFAIIILDAYIIYLSK